MRYLLFEDTNVIAEVRSIRRWWTSEISVLFYLLMLRRRRFYLTQNSNHYSDQLIHFSGVIGDNEDAPEDLIVSWSSSVDGDLILDTSPDADGVISDYGYLSEGQHVPSNSEWKVR